MEQKYIDTHEFIKRRWKDGLRETQDPDYPLPFPFEPPCVDGLFQYLFYWDTFFTNRGLILDGEVQIAKWNTDNLIYLLKKYINKLLGSNIFCPLTIFKLLFPVVSSYSSLK